MALIPLSSFITTVLGQHSPWYRNRMQLRLALAVPNLYKYSAGTSPDYEKAHSVAEALFGHDRVDLPYSLLLIGY